MDPFIFAMLGMLAAGCGAFAIFLAAEWIDNRAPRARPPAE